MLIQLATLINFSKPDIFSSATWTIYFWCVPAVVLGIWLGHRLFDHIDDDKCRQPVLWFLMISGLTLLL